MFADKAVKKDTSERTQARGLYRYYIDLRAQKKAGLVPTGIVRKDDSGNVFETVAAAVNFARKIEASIRVGGTAGDRDKTFGDAHAAWEESLKLKLRKETIEKGTYQDDTAQVRNHLIGKWTLRDVPIENVRLSTITHSLLNKELLTKKAQLFDVQLARPGKIKLLQKFRAIFEIAVAERWIAASPATRISLEEPTVDPADKAIDPAVFGRFKDDIPSLLSALEVVDPDAVLPIEVLRNTGVRGGELVVLSLDQITTTVEKSKFKINRTWKSRSKKIGKPKGGKSREVAAYFLLGLELTTHALKHQRRGSDFLFGKDGCTPLNRAGLRHRWHQAQFALRGWGFFKSSNTRDSSRAYSLVELPKPIAEFTHDEWESFAFGQAGLRKGEQRERISFPTIEAAAEHIRLTLFGLHDLRHLYASQLLHAGAPLRRVAQRLGDEESTVQEYYAHYLPEDHEADLADIAAIR